jgi:hypothetical protein
VENPSPTSCLRPRSNPRSFAFTFFSPLHIVRGRSLTADEVRAINFILKKRAVRYIAAQEEEWLDPEFELQIPGLDALLQPRKVTLIKSIRASFSDGRQVTLDRLGNTYNRPTSALRDGGDRSTDWKFLKNTDLGYSQLTAIMSAGGE